MKKKFILFVIIGLFFVVIIIRLFFGVINIKVNIPFKNPTYIISISDLETGFDLETRKTNTIIPFFLKFTSVIYFYSVNGNSTINYDFGKPINILIDSYYCYNDVTGKEKQTICTNDNSNLNLKKIENIKYTKMEITGGSTSGRSNMKIYEGNYVSDITNIIKNKGLYQIKISSNYDNYDSDIIFSINLV